MSINEIQTRIDIISVFLLFNIFFNIKYKKTYILVFQEIFIINLYVFCISSNVFSFAYRNCSSLMHESEAIIIFSSCGLLISCIWFTLQVSQEQCFTGTWHSQNTKTLTFGLFCIGTF